MPPHGIGVKVFFEFSRSLTGVVARPATMSDAQQQQQPQEADTATTAEDRQEVPPTKPDGPENAVENQSVFETVSSAATNLASTVLVYALGYWRVATVSTWVLLPLMAVVSVVRDRWREAGRLKRRRAQLAAAADEQGLINASLSELPSWVFFPDVHRAEWLNQVHNYIAVFPLVPPQSYPNVSFLANPDHQAAVADGQCVRS